LTQNHLALQYRKGSTAASTQFDNYFSLKGAWLLPFSSIDTPLLAAGYFIVRPAGA
jgi:hypothetical protein